MLHQAMDYFIQDRSSNVLINFLRKCIYTWNFYYLVKSNPIYSCRRISCRKQINFWTRNEIRLHEVGNLWQFTRYIHWKMRLFSTKGDKICAFVTKSKHFSQIPLKMLKSWGVEYTGSLFEFASNNVRHSALQSA